MRARAACLTALAMAFAALAATAVADGAVPDKAVGTTATRPPTPFDPRAMAAMLRADRDKDGGLSREELDHYDLTLSRRFRQVDGDRDGRLTLYEFEKLVDPTQQASRR